MKIAFTSDIDWAPEQVIEDFLDLFLEYNVKCTFFCTHESHTLKKANKDLIELAIHPNFNDNFLGKTNNSPKNIIDNLMNIYPEAVGVRSHSLTSNSYLQLLFHELGLLYDSNLYYPFVDKAQAYKCWTGLTRIPFHWEDDLHFYEKKSYDFDFTNLIENNRLILNFHPIHVFLNTDCLETYQQGKKFYQEPNELIKFRNKDKIGTRDLLIKLLKQSSDMNFDNVKLKEIL